MIFPIGATVVVSPGRRGYHPHVVPGQEYRITGVNHGKFVLDRCSALPGRCTGVCSSGWYWDDGFTFKKKVLLCPGDLLVVTRTLHECARAGETVRVESVEPYTFSIRHERGVEKGAHCRWSYNSDFVYIFPVEPPITEEEARQAKCLPTPEEAWQFVTRGRKGS